MAHYSSYWLYQKYEKRGDQDWIPSYPNVYSISGDSSDPMPLVVRIEKDVDCGYKCDEIERWVEIPITEDYECDDCEVGYLYRWVQCNPSAYTYYGDYKYDILCEEISQDNGETWSATTRTKVSSASTGVADKKVKVTFDNGDTFAVSCGSDNGVWYSFPQTSQSYWSQDVPQHTTNLYHNEVENFFVGNGTMTAVGYFPHNSKQFVVDYYYLGNTLKGVKKLSFSDCVFEIGDRYRNYATFNTDIAESGQALSGVNHTFYCNNGLHYGWGLGDGWGIEELVLPNTLKWIGGLVFAKNNIRTLTLPSSVESIGYVRAWDYDGVHVQIDTSYSNTFAFNPRLITVNLNEGLKSIGSADFMDCTALETIEIPSTVERMGTRVFTGCTNLKQIIFKGETPPETMCEPNSHFTYDCNAYFSVNTDTIVYVPCGSKSAYTEWISDLPDEKIVEYGGNCPSVPSIDDVYRTVVSYKVGSTTYNVHRGLSSDTTVFTADTTFFSDNYELYNDASEVTIKDNVWLNYYHDSQYQFYGTNIAGTYDKLVLENSGGIGYANIDGVKEIIYKGDGGFIEESFDNCGVESIIVESGNTNAVDLSFGFRNNPYLTAVTINGNTSLRGNVFANCTNLSDVYINYSGGVLTVNTGSTSVSYPFYNTNPTIHVPCELYDVYRANDFWSNLNIVRDTDQCQQIDPDGDREPTFEIVSSDWQYKGSGSSSFFFDDDDGYYVGTRLSYESRTKDDEIVFTVKNKGIKIEFEHDYYWDSKVYKDGVEVTVTQSEYSPFNYIVGENLTGDYTTHTYRIVRTADTYTESVPLITKVNIYQGDIS